MTLDDVFTAEQASEHMITYMNANNDMPRLFQDEAVQMSIRYQVTPLLKALFQEISSVVLYVRDNNRERERKEFDFFQRAHDYLNDESDFVEKFENIVFGLWYMHNSYYHNSCYDYANVDIEFISCAMKLMTIHRISDGSRTKPARKTTQIIN